MAATSYASIKSMSADFKTMISNLEYPFPFNVGDTSMVILVDIENDLDDILAANPTKLALILGMDENSPTVCILGADANGDILEGHVAGTLDGQEVWPDAQKIKYSEDTEYDSFFVTPE